MCQINTVEDFLLTKRFINIDKFYHLFPPCAGCFSMCAFFILSLI